MAEECRESFRVTSKSGGAGHSELPRQQASVRRMGDGYVIAVQSRAPRTVSLHLRVGRVKCVCNHAHAANLVVLPY